MNATRLPSGAMSEKPASIGASVSRRWCEPSAFMIQTAATSPPIVLSNTMRRPSGVYSGQKLSQMFVVSACIDAPGVAAIVVITFEVRRRDSRANTIARAVRRPVRGGVEAAAART